MYKELHNYFVCCADWSFREQYSILLCYHRTNIRNIFFIHECVSLEGFVWCSLLESLKYQNIPKLIPKYLLKYQKLCKELAPEINSKLVFQLTSNIIMILIMKMKVLIQHYISVVYFYYIKVRGGQFFHFLMKFLVVFIVKVFLQFIFLFYYFEIKIL